MRQGSTLPPRCSPASASRRRRGGDGPQGVHWGAAHRDYPHGLCGATVTVITRAPMPVITTTPDLKDLCRRLSEHSFVAVDTEFIREQTFWPRLCVIQLAGPGDEAIVDPLAPGMDLASFFGLMADERVVKVFHAARQDLEIVWTLARLIPHPIFDTQVAAMVCGFGESVSYVSLVKQITGHTLDKTSRFTDWARRPLSDKQLAYALADVTHLRDIYRRLVEELEATGRVRWLDEEMAELT